MNSEEQEDRKTQIKIRNGHQYRRKSFATVISKQFDSPAGEHLQLKDYAKNSLKYPTSYTHLDTTYIRNNDEQEILVKTMYTGQDDYKTERVYCAKAIYSFHGQVIMPPKLCWDNYD